PEELARGGPGSGERRRSRNGQARSVEVSGGDDIPRIVDRHRIALLVSGPTELDGPEERSARREHPDDDVREAAVGRSRDEGRGPEGLPAEGDAVAARGRAGGEPEQSPSQGIELPRPERGAVRGADRGDEVEIAGRTDGVPDGERAREAAEERHRPVGGDRAAGRPPGIPSRITEA